MQFRNLFFLIVLTSLIQSSCVSNKKFSGLYLDSTVLIAQIESNIKSSNPVPSKTEWQESKQDFIDRMKDFKATYSKTMKKSNTTSVTIAVSTTVIGVGGGIFGLIANDSDAATVAGITSLTTGAVTGLTVPLNLQKKSEKANKCLDFLDSALLNFSVTWSDDNYPSTADKYLEYNEAKKQLLESLSEVNCFGRP